MARLLILAAIIALAPSCAPRPWVAVARTGSLTDLQRSVEVASERRQFNDARTRSLAQVILEREIATATDAAAFDRVVGLQACASELYWPLNRRSKGIDDGAAAASLVLLEAGLQDPDERSLSFSHSSSGAWRAVAARSAVAPELRSRVYAALLDPDQRVRSAAIRTIQASPILADGKALTEVARLDPDDSLKVASLLALGDIGDLNSLLSVREFWDEMNQPARMAYLQALYAPASRSRGGARILTRIMESDESLEGVVAASLMCHEPAPSSGYAISRLLRAVHQGTTSERLVALASLPKGDTDAQVEIRKLALSNNPYLRVAALESWLSAPTLADGARRRLQFIAAGKDADAFEASRVLALNGDESSILRVNRRLFAPLAEQRIAAARLLLRLGRWGAVARALTDDHPLVRLTIACNVLSRSN